MRQFIPKKHLRRLVVSYCSFVTCADLWRNLFIDEYLSIRYVLEPGKFARCYKSKHNFV